MNSEHYKAKTGNGERGFFYKGYHGSFKRKHDDRVYHGRIEGILDIISFQGETLKELQEDFKEGVEDYLEACKNIVKKEPFPSFKPFVYLASPYKHKNPEVMKQRFEMACYVAGVLMNRDEVVFSPIAHNHSIAQQHELPKGWDFWKKFDKRFLLCSKALYILMIPGWKESVGVKAEVEIALRMKLPIIGVDAKGDFQKMAIHYDEIGPWPPIPQGGKSSTDELLKESANEDHTRHLK